MITIACDVRLGAALVAAASLTSSPAAADCTCRALGQDFELGRVICLSTANGPRLATCGMVLNNTSWRISDTPCVSAPGDVARVSDREPLVPGGRQTHLSGAFRQLGRLR